MAKPQRRPAPAPSKSASSPSAALPAYELPEFFYNTRLQSLLLFAFAFLLYANTLTHGFVQDDAIVITEHANPDAPSSELMWIITSDRVRCAERALVCQ